MLSAAPNPDRHFFLSRYSQAKNVIVTPRLVPQSVAFDINGLFHCEILLYNSVVDAWHEWYVACCWSIYDKTMNRYVVMLVSATD